MLIIKKLGAIIISLSVAYYEGSESIAELFTSNSFLQGCIMGLFYNITPLTFLALTILFG